MPVPVQEGYCWVSLALFPIADARTWVCQDIYDPPQGPSRLEEGFCGSEIVGWIHGMIERTTDLLSGRK